MAIHRGIQSAIFYYLSCAPCAEARYRKKRKQERARSRLEREILEAENPNLYRQPSPSSTNPHWQSEIDLGPVLAARGRRKNNAAGQRGKGAMNENVSAEQSCIDLPKNTRGEDRNDSRWNFRVYQREDEELWGSVSNLDAASSYAGSLARPKRALTRDSHNTYDTHRNPEVNDMHPATFTKVSSPEEVMWMLQPPPVAEIMQGKERVSRSRSDSGGSRMVGSSSASLSRQLSSRLVQNKLRALDSATPMSRESSSRTVNGPYASRHDRSATTSQRDFAVSPIPIDAKDLRMPSPVLLPSEPELIDNLELHRSLPADTINAPHLRTSISRSQLASIPSNREIPVLSGAFKHDKSQSSSSKENGLPTPPQSRDAESISHARLAVEYPYVISDASVKVAGNVTPRSLNGKVIRTHTSPEGQDGGRRTPGHNYGPSEDFVLRPELVESWYTPDFELGKWVHETTKREVKQRWSMEF